MLKKISNIFLTIFAVGVLLAMLAGALAFLGFIVAMFIGGEVATEISVFIHKTYFPWVIKFTSIFVGCGLVGMYLGKKKSLSVGSESNEKSDITESDNEALNEDLSEESK